MFLSDKWIDFEVIDCSDGERLERWGKYILIRPDPQAVWRSGREDRRWKQADATYIRSNTGGGHWENKRLPDAWKISYRDLSFNLKPMTFKHTGLFPEQADNWDFAAERIRERLRQGRSARVLNLFAYTGAASISAAEAGAEVCHVDAAKGMVAWAKENAKLSGLESAPIRWIVDDCAKFIEREIRRGRTYDMIIMDPPSYGRGPSGEVWKIENDLYNFVALCTRVMSDDPDFMMISSYSTGLAPSVSGYILGLTAGKRFGRGECVCAELALPVSSTGMALPCGATARIVF
ncbi:MAG: SAM-dependent methyltransferase [Clostridiales bacterium]|jgi:23S rRNA (cytosine1962-C5)-methyltransferase|nr:SAM-dependent methyltransferase [Clostridiales bacterium]